jgi:hypothetical protein
MPAVDQRRGAAAVEVDRALGPELDHRLGELEHRQPSVDAGAPPVARDGGQEVVRDSERRARMAAVGDVRVELPRPGGESLAVLGWIEDDLPGSNEQRASVDQVA